jgi:hypothetical protein
VIFKKIKNYIKVKKNSSVDTGLSSICYFSTSSSALGHHFFIKKFIKKNYNLKFVYFYIKQIFSISKAFNIRVEKKKNYFRFKKIFITWGFKKDFDKNGNIIDQYFRISSKNKSVLWLVLYFDKNLPKKISDNIILISNLHTSKKINIFSSFYYFFKSLHTKNFKIEKIFHETAYTSHLAENILNKIIDYLDINYVEKIFTPYEGQPFQHYIASKFKEINKKIKFYGYVSHNLPHSFDMILRQGSPDFLFLQSEDQKKYLIKNLGWNSKKIKLIHSLRFKKTNKKKLINKIYFPNQISDMNNLVNNFQYYLSTCKNFSIPKMKINTHPRAYNSEHQLKLKKKFMEIIRKYKKKFNNNKKNISIVVGLTASPIYLLAHQIKVIHIVEDNFFQSYSSKYWPSINSKKINNFIYEYSLLKNKEIIKIKNKSSNFLKKIILN